tara:strand:+ start:18291 stop:20552 length:2262 start_codon:yes stop_codon:yes gene_type:complete
LRNNKIQKRNIGGYWINDNEIHDKFYVPKFFDKDLIYNLIFIFIFLVAFSLRLYSLGDRAVHHDESLHGYFAYQMYIGSGYEHNPLMHGIFLFQLVSLSFFFFGDSEFSLRFPMALVGSIIIFLPILMKDRLGHLGSIFASLMLAISPSILYFSRFARNDIFMLFIFLLLVIAMWKYFSNKDSKWLYIFSIFMAIGFITKETQYIFVAIISMFLIFMAKDNIKNWLFGKIPITSFNDYGKFLIFVIILSAPMLAASISIFQNVINITLANNDTNSLTPIGLPESNGQLFAIIISLLLLLSSILVSFIFNKKLFFLPFLIFISLVFLFFTNFLSNLSGISTGIWQSLGYWIAQQDVARGSQPWYYYITLGSIYEFMPLGISFLGFSYFLIKSRYLSLFPIVIIIVSFVILADNEASYTNGKINTTGIFFQLILYFSILILPLTIKASNFYKFLFFWAISSFLLYTYAGEKMPWLITNITLPFILLSSKILNDFFTRVKFSYSHIKYYIIIFFSALLFINLLWRLITHDLGTETEQFLNIWLIFLIFGFLFFILQSISRVISKKQTFYYFLIPLLLLTSIFTFRSSWILNYNNFDTPNEMMIYTQTSPHLHKVSKTIDKIAFQSLEEKSIRISVDTTDAFSWPWQWYLRQYENVTFDDHTQDINIDDVSILLLSYKNDLRGPERNNFTQGQKFPFRWWFPEKYKNAKFSDVVSTIFDKNRWNNSLDYFIYRKLEYDLGSIDSYLYIQKDYNYDSR